MIIGLGLGLGLGSQGIALETDFVWTVATTGSDETFTIPCQDVGTFDAVIDWGDGSTSAINSYNDADLAHSYVSSGNQQIRISGTFPNIYFNGGGDSLKVKSVENLGRVGLTRLDSAFKGCSNMTSFVGGNTDTSLVVRLDEMFRSCSALATTEFNKFDTSSVTNMSSMFIFCEALTALDLSSFDTSLVTDMTYMVRGCFDLVTINLSSFDTSLVTDMQHMFFQCFDLTTLDLRNFDTSLVTDMNRMFLSCNSLTNILGIEDFDIGSLNSTGSLTSMAITVTLPTAVYDDLLVKWDAQNPFNGMSPNFGNSTYTAGGTAAAARANLISSNGWTITDGGAA